MFLGLLPEITDASTQSHPSDLDSISFDVGPMGFKMHPCVGVLAKEIKRDMLGEIVDKPRIDKSSTGPLVHRGRDAG